MNDSAGPQIFMHELQLCVSYSLLKNTSRFDRKAAKGAIAYLFSTKLRLIKHFINVELQTRAQMPDSTTGVRLARIPACIAQQAFVLERLYTSHLNKHGPSGKNTTSRRIDILDTVPDDVMAELPVSLFVTFHKAQASTAPSMSGI